MAVVNTYACDVCQVQKKETNHWWMVSARSDGRFVEVMRWGAVHEDVANDPGVKHACGQEHVLQLVERWLTTGNLEPASQRQITKPVNAETAEIAEQPRQRTKP